MQLSELQKIYLDRWIRLVHIQSFLDINPWELVERRKNGLLMRNRSGLGVIATIDREEDREIWVQVSSSRLGEKPTWRDVAQVRKEFFEPHEKVFRAVPKGINAKHYNYETMSTFWHCPTNPNHKRIIIPREANL